MAYAVLEKTLDYFLHPQNSWLYGQDVHRAMTAFSGSLDPLPERSLDFFLDWFGFDFAFRSGQSLLKYACDSNPMQLGVEDLAALREIAEHNRYEFFEVVARARRATELQSVRDGSRYALANPERLRKVRVGEVIVCRLGRIQGGWHLMMDQGVGMYRPGASDKSRMQKGFPVLNSQVVWREIVSANAVLLDAEVMPDGEMLVSGFAPGSSHQEEDDCPICRAMRKAKTEKRKLTHQELTDAFAEANKEKDRKRKT